MLAALLRQRIPQDRIVTRDLLETLAHLAHGTRREVGLYADRHGTVKDVVVARRWQELLPTLQARASATRPVGLRYIAARPRPEAEPDEADARHLLEARLDLAAIVGSQRGAATEGWLISLGPARKAGGGGPEPVPEGPYEVDALSRLELGPRTRAIESVLRRSPVVATKGTRPERAILVGLELRGDRADRESPDAVAAVVPSAAESLDELERLAETAGAAAVGRVVQARRRPDPATFIGRGKVEEVSRILEERDADLVVLDDELTPAQQRNLERELGVKVIDRTALVLDIFAHRAQTHEGRVQVELAQLTYLLPRLTGRGVWLSRLGGGIGTRGPGETKLEVDRRRVRDRITDLRRDLRAVERQRSLQRAGRRAAGVPVAAIVGYTNAGKSTLLNALTQAGVLVENRLFATLDPTVRRVTLPNGRPVLLVDTVGFLHKLPTHLVAAFRATLEEAVAADLLVHVIDASHPHWDHQRRVAERILADLGAAGRPRLNAFNKVDLLDGHHRQALRREHPEAVLIAAAHGVGLLNLLRLISQRLPEPLVRLRLLLPYSEAGRLAEVFAQGRILTQRYEGDRIVAEVELPGPLAARLQVYAAEAATRPSDGSAQ